MRSSIFANRRLRLLACTSALVSFISSTVHAQVAAPGGASVVSPSESGQIGEIVVTAERRTESVQKTPLTIQAITGKQVASAGITDVSALNRVTAGVQIGNGGGSSQIFIRGVGGFNFDTVSTPGVAFNVDGVYVARPDGVNGNFYDLARVEVIKGPQGTLYGRNANGGAINLITNEPKLKETSGSFAIEGGSYSLVHATGALNIPIGENLALRAAFNIVNRNGYLSNGANDDKQQSGRLRLKWQASDDVTINLSGDVTHLGGRGNDYVYLPKRPGASPYEAESSAAANAYMHAFPGGLGNLQGDVPDGSFQKSTLANVSGQLDWHFPDFATLTVLEAYRHANVDFQTNIAGPIRFKEPDASVNSTEVRLGNGSSNLTWVVGGYYSYEANPNGYTFVSTGTGIPPNPPVTLQNSYGINSPTTLTYAGFGQLTYRVSGGLRLIAGGRYTKERHHIVGASHNATTGAITEAFDTKANFGGFSYKAGVEYDLSPTSMLFLTHSTGFRSGGLNKTIAPLNVYDPEHLRSTEFGSRNRLLNNKLQLNFGAFYWKYKGIQTNIVTLDPAGVVNFATFNAGTATLYGGNVEIVGRITRDDTLTLSAEYAHSKYDSFILQTPTRYFLAGQTGCPTSASGTNTVINCAGYQVARTPKWTGTFSYDHVFHFANKGTLTLNTAVKFSSANWLANDFTPSERQGGYATVDAAMDYRNPTGRWSIGLYGRNLSKAVYYTGGISSAFIPNLFNASIAAPRTFGGRASINF